MTTAILVLTLVTSSFGAEKGAKKADEQDEQKQAKLLFQQIADEEIAKIAADPRLSDEAREAQIKEIQKERKRMSTEFKKSLRKEKR